MTNEIIGRGWAFPPKIEANGVALTTEQNEIEQAIQIILMTPIGQRVMRPEFGSRLLELLFEPNNSHTAARARRYVEEALERWEPRINIKDVRVSPNYISVSPNYKQDNKKVSSPQLMIEIDYEVKSTHDKRSLVYPFYLIPEEG
ncbi:MAG: GPW/gp25 family protein [Anaerolineaceae bacterium]|nr:GPW/gp25 family protein [Anaerolineaceae bacterium]